MEQDFLRKQKNKKLKRKLIILCLALVAIAAIGFSIAAKLKAQDKKPEDAKVTIEIRCDELSSNMDILLLAGLLENVHDGRLIALYLEARFLNDNAILWNIVYKRLICKHIHIEDKKGYVKGINYLYEFSAGQKSGWMYKVNGKLPNYMASEVKLKDGDEILWFYTVDYDKENYDTK